MFSIDSNFAKIESFHGNFFYFKSKDFFKIFNLNTLLDFEPTNSEIPKNDPITIKVSRNSSFLKCYLNFLFNF